MRRVALLALVLSVASAQDKDKPQRKYQVEFLYTIHKKLTAENYERIERLFGKTWPKLDLRKLEPTDAQMREYFRLHTHRLLAQAGTSWTKIQEGVLRGQQPTPELQKTCLERAFEFVKRQVDREVRLRGIYWFWRDQAAEDEGASLRRIFDKLGANEDPKSPVLSTEPGKGLIMYLRPDHALTHKEIAVIEDSGVKFTDNVSCLVAHTSNEELPKVSRKAQLLGSAGHGRVIFRLVRMEYSRHPRLLDAIRAALSANFPEGLDRERTNPAAGEYWTHWHYKVGQLYRETRRTRAHVKIRHPVGDTPVIEVEVFTQVNDNIDEPSNLKNARWVGRLRDSDREARIKDAIERHRGGDEK